MQYFVHFLKFTSGFAIILALSLIALQVTGGYTANTVAPAASGW